MNTSLPRVTMLTGKLLLDTREVQMVLAEQQGAGGIVVEAHAMTCTVEVC